MGKAWRVTSWRGHVNHECAAEGCQYKTLDEAAMRQHVRTHRLVARGILPLAGVNFASDEAAEAAAALGCTRAELDPITPSGRGGGYTVADVKAAARNPRAEND